jgi:hypothetical protein
MEDSHAPKRAAVVYAVLSLLVRLIASQSAVLSLWFSRRSFERSRGEMITMLYEKMLKRKVIGVQEKGPEAETESISDTIENPDRSAQKREQDKQSASIGKVLNLMR